MKDVSNQQVAEHLKRLNPWWQSGEMDADTLSLHPRAYLGPVLRLLQEPKLRRAVVLLGPRRVGKTILIRHLVADLLKQGVSAQRIDYVEMDHPLLHGQTLEALIRQIEEAAPGGDGTRYLFFDEIQSHRDWEKHLKPLVDHRPDLKILVSGSAAAALKRQSTESGAGRFTDFLLPPLTFSEYLQLRQEPAAIIEEAPDRYALVDITRLNAQFAEYVNYGGYPELALSPTVRANPERFVKSDIVDKVLLRDLPQLYGIKDIQELNSLFTLLAFNTAEEVSFEQLSQRSGVGKPTIQKYIEYLEAAFLIKRVFRVDQDGKRYQRERHFKVYLTNSAMYTGLFGARSADDPEFGHLVETALFAQRFHEDARLNYARWGSEDCEVDLVESSQTLKPVAALEIKWSDKFADRPEALKGLMKFVRGNHLPLAWATTRSRIEQQVIDGCEIRQWPAAALAFHYGVRAVQGRMAGYEAQIKSITA
ncbi:MAG TPA: ATP-binding protein [Dokdonella sp.]|uniref:ATP-binding protein n=1 Tax=Dokdonella sp. TaxID=2291710 RepID=UPI0025B843E3|nr:ATP-binding protein [Dokdonella sp.]MBX3691919.1 ATP-binding protein [Dokdonella sp.]HNR90841.1 ATP-binding protein [Dokdonella sp.]